MTDIEELEEVWALIHELEDVSTRLSRAATAAMESLGLNPQEREGPE